MSSCSRDTTSIKYSKMVSLFWMIVILLRMWRLVRKLVKRYFHHFVSRADVRMNLFVFQQKNFFVEWKKKLETEGGYYYWRYSRCASNDEAKNLSIPVISQHANRISKLLKIKMVIGTVMKWRSWQLRLIKSGGTRK